MSRRKPPSMCGGEARGRSHDGNAAGGGRNGASLDLCSQMRTLLAAAIFAFAARCGGDEVDTRCEDQLRADCGGRGLSAPACLLCAGRHPVDLRKAGCNHTDISSWCDSKGGGQSKCQYSHADNCSTPGAGCAWCALSPASSHGGLCCGERASCCSSSRSASCCGGEAFCCGTVNTQTCCETGSTCCRPSTPSAGGNRSSVACCSAGAQCCAGGASGEATCCSAPFKCCPNGAPGCCK
jgi:hypothetical protein